MNSGKPTLTKRQIEVLQLLAEGKVAKEIGRKLGISIKTVDKHRDQIYKRFGPGPQNAAGVCVAAIRAGIIA